MVANREARRPAWTERVGAAAIVGAATAFVLWHLRPDLLLTPTIATGGDTASHYYTASWLLNELLPAGRLSGWVPGNYAGFPLFQIYFPLPFVAMVALSFVTGLPVAFKLVTVAGLVGLPAAAFACFRLLRFSAPTPALAAVFSVAFLFHEANSMWGANVASTLAGEFTYSIGTALLLVFGGTLYRGVSSGRGWVGNGVLLAAVGLCHAYTLLVAASFGAYLVLFHPVGRRAVSYLLKVGALAFGLMAFWAVPLLLYAEYTTAYSVVWPIRGFTHVFPVIFWPLLAALVLGTGFRVVSRLRTARSGRTAAPFDHRVAYLASVILGSLLLYLAGWKLDVVDMRFLPFVQLMTALLAAIPVAAVVRRIGTGTQPWRRPVSAMATVMLAVATLAWVETKIEFIDDWVAWNYGGFESTPGWDSYRAVNDAVSRTAADPRVVYEHTPAHNESGTVRAFESLPLFSGASTLEGIYMQSTISSPFVFYIQSEISRIPSCPLLPYHCGRLDPARAAEHLRLFNVSDVITRSALVTDALAGSPDFTPVADVSPYRVFRVEGGSGSYVEPLRFEPLVLSTEDWPADAFEWFKRPGSGQVVLLRAQAEPTGAPGGASRPSAAWPRVSSLPDVMPRRPLAEPVEVVSELDAEEIRIRTSRPGHPLLVKVSYHPRWRVEGASQVWLASPSFMVVVPDQEEIRLVYGPSAVDRAGLALTALAVGWAGWAGLVGRRRQPVAEAARPWLDQLFVRRWLWAPVLLAVIGSAAAATRLAWTDPWTPHRDGLALFHAGDYVQAEPLFTEAITASPSSAAAYYSDYYLSLCAHRTERWAQSLERFGGFLRRYPDGELVPEAHFRVAEALGGLGRDRDSVEQFMQIVDEFPETQWAGFAAERLAGAAREP